MRQIKNSVALNTIALVVIILISCGFDCSAASKVYNVYGENVKSAFPMCYVVDCKESINIRTSPQVYESNGRTKKNDNIAFQLNDGDTIYVSSAPSTVSNDGVVWYQFTVGENAVYGSQKYFNPINNNNYVRDVDGEEEANEVVEYAFVKKIPVYSPWILLFLTLLFFCLSYLPYPVNAQSFVGPIRQSTGMRPIFVFQKQPYTFVLGIVARLVVGVVISVLIFLLIGLLVWGALWVMNIIVWVIVIIGWILAVGGVLAAICGAIPAVIAAAIGIFIVCYQEELFAFGKSCVALGEALFSALNILKFVWTLIVQYWQNALIICASPIILFVTIALIVVLVSGILILFEKITTSHYNIKHPCPFCHEPSEPAEYLSEYQKLPIHLRPGIYGMLHVVHPLTGEKMPTLILNGRDKLMRICPHCKEIISYETGVEKHLAFIGLPESGKTCLTYRFIGNLMRNNPAVEFTDEISNEAKQIILDIKAGKQQELASKTSVADVRRSIQILVPGKALLPYHFFINDVGGELFTTSGSNEAYVKFFKDVESVAVLIDPFTTDFSEYDLGKEFSSWYDNNVKGKNVATVCGKLSNVLDSVQTMSDHFTHKLNKIHMNIVLVKADTGYVDKDIIADEAKLREFVAEQLGLAAEIYNLEKSYASLHFYAVSALKDEGIDRLTDGIMNELVVS